MLKNSVQVIQELVVPSPPHPDTNGSTMQGNHQEFLPS